MYKNAYKKTIMMILAAAMGILPLIGITAASSDGAVFDALSSNGKVDLLVIFAVIIIAVILLMLLWFAVASIVNKKKKSSPAPVAAPAAKKEAAVEDTIPEHYMEKNVYVLPERSEESEYVPEDTIPEHYMEKNVYVLPERSEESEYVSEDTIPEHYMEKSEYVLPERSEEPEYVSEDTIPEHYMEKSAYVVPAGSSDSDAASEAEEEEYDEYLEGMEDTPNTTLRRAIWNKGLRCRNDYGVHHIPIALVKAKVAVYLETERGDTSIDSTLAAEGWTVFRFLESDITDGEKQANEIKKAARENIGRKK
ncbi:MAG: hypothetical protein FWG41_04415 [Methanomassiliicoccaceae archaeon]|nr:hypothetical protein [Methanomassiliicoccaceae archaeon]